MFTSLNEWSLKRNAFEMLHSFLLKILASIILNLWKRVILSFEKLRL